MIMIMMSMTTMTTVLTTTTPMSKPSSNTRCTWRSASEPALRLSIVSVGCLEAERSCQTKKSIFSVDREPKQHFATLQKGIFQR